MAIGLAQTERAVSDLNRKTYGTIEAWRNRPIESAPARLVLLRPFADAKNLSITLVIHPDRYQQRHVADLAETAADLEQDPRRNRDRDRQSGP